MHYQTFISVVYVKCSYSRLNKHPLNDFIMVNINLIRLQYSLFYLILLSRRFILVASGIYSAV